MRWKTLRCRSMFFASRVQLKYSQSTAFVQLMRQKFSWWATRHDRDFPGPGSIDCLWWIHGILGPLCTIECTPETRFSHTRRDYRVYTHDVWPSAQKDHTAPRIRFNSIACSTFCSYYFGGGIKYKHDDIKAATKEEKEEKEGDLAPAPISDARLASI